MHDWVGVDGFFFPGIDLSVYGRFQSLLSHLLIYLVGMQDRL